MTKITNFSRKMTNFLCERLLILKKLNKIWLKISYFRREWWVKMKKPEKCTFDHSSCTFFNACFAKIPIFPIVKGKIEKKSLPKSAQNRKTPPPEPDYPIIPVTRLPWGTNSHSMVMPPDMWHYPPSATCLILMSEPHILSLTPLFDIRVYKLLANKHLPL